MTPALAGYIKQPSLIENIRVSDRAKNMLLRQTDTEKLVNVTTCHVQTFNVSDPGDLKAYTDLLDSVSNRRVELRFISRQWLPDNSGVMVYAEWADFVLDKE